MLPFHKIYGYIFKSFNINSETETIERLKDEGIKRIMIIKRSWIFGLAMIWAPILIVFIGIVNLYISYFSYSDKDLKYSLLIGVSCSLLLFVFSVWSYLSHFRKIYDIPRIENDSATLFRLLQEGDIYFIRFFNQTILNQWILMGLMIWSGYYYMTHMGVKWGIWILIDIAFLFIQWILLGRYRKKMIDLEMDYNIVTPGKILFVNQSGMLSSSQAVEGEKVKTVSAKYPSWIASFFQYGNIEIMTEGGESNLGSTSMYYVPHPTETAGLIQTMLLKEDDANNGNTAVRHNDHTPSEMVQPSRAIGPKEVSYDVKGTVRDVLR